MLTDETLIQQVKKRFEEKTGWGDSAKWTNQDFLRLSESILEQTGVTISHVTLKRVWGKVKYDSLPNTHTLNTLVQFLGYESWRDFAAKHPDPPAPQPAAPDLDQQPIPQSSHSYPSNPNSSRPQGTLVPPPPSGQPPLSPLPDAGSSNQPGQMRIARATLPKTVLRKAIWIAVPLVVILLVLALLHGQQPSPLSQDYTFSSKKVVTSGVPNSVIFDYDATRSPEDSVIIQQSWDTSRRVKVSKSGHQHTSVYYYPDFYHATLQVQNKVVKTHSLLIGSNGWLPLVEQSPVPVYFKKEEVIKDGKMSLPVSKILEKNIPMQPHAPTVMFTNVGDFGEIYSDHFVFETSLKNDYAEGSAVCQLTRVYLLCEGTAIWIPLCSPGCVSTVDLYFTYFYTSGKREDLSAFGVDFSKYVKLRVESDSGHAKILINDKLAYTISRHIIRSKIIGIMTRFQGTGSIDYVSLSNGKVNYRDDF
jgi:hypothetical protein